MPMKGVVLYKDGIYYVVEHNLSTQAATVAKDEVLGKAAVFDHASHRESDAGACPECQAFASELTR